MSRIGLSIDDGSTSSCCSDLSESETSYSLWNDVNEIAQETRGRGITMSLDTGVQPNRHLHREGSVSISLPDFELCQSSLPPGTGYRSRIRHRLEELERRNSAAEDEDGECPRLVSRHPNPRLRLYFALFSLCLVIFSLDSANSTTRAIATDIRREEVVFPLHQQLRRPDQKRMKSELPKYYFPKAEPQNDAVAFDASAAEKPKRRMNIAMARSSVESRPVFGAKIDNGGTTENIERFVLDDARMHHNRRGSKGPSLTSWMAGLSLVFILLETSYKEYRRCRISHDEERRL